MGPQPGLAWIPAGAELVAGVDVAAVRQQTWLVETLQRSAGGVEEDLNYRAFVEATGFDYTRDLDQVWLGLFDSGPQPPTAGVAVGRLDRPRILRYARAQGARTLNHHGFEVYELPARAVSTAPAGQGFVFAFLDDTHLAFASDGERAASLIACWRGEAPSVGSDELRRAELLRLAAGWQAWVVDSGGHWTTLLGENAAEAASVATSMSAGLRADAESLAVGAEARCRTAGQAEHLHGQLNLLKLIGQMALLQQRDEGARLLGGVLEGVQLGRDGESVQARVTLPAATVDKLLRSAPAVSQKH